MGKVFHLCLECSPTRLTKTTDNQLDIVIDKSQFPFSVGSISRGIIYYPSI